VISEQSSAVSENWGLLGHEWAVNLLRQHIAHDAVRHAYLLTGPRGVGRRTLALRFAQALNCPNPPAAGEACGTCRTCKQTEAMRYTDLAVIQAETEGGTLKIDQVREIQHILSLKPYQSKYRVAIFLRFHEANPNAQNALLKTLEEAPEHVILVLTADSAEQLLPTIVSRCEIMRLRPLPVEGVTDYLKQNGTQPEFAQLLAHLSGGRPGYALRLQAEPEELTLRTEKLDDLNKLLSASRVEKFAYAEKLSKDKESFRKVLLIWLSYWRDVMLKSAEAEAPLANIDRTDEITALAGKLSLAQVRKIVSDTELGIERLEKNVNARLLAEVYFLDLPTL
jgi:DNA polymerase III subunit delta'